MNCQASADSRASVSFELIARKHTCTFELLFWKSVALVRIPWGAFSFKSHLRDKLGRRCNQLPKFSIPRIFVLFVKLDAGSSILISLVGVENLGMPLSLSLSFTRVILAALVIWISNAGLYARAPAYNQRYE